jgi:hypothetical protein
MSLLFLLGFVCFFVLVVIEWNPKNKTINKIIENNKKQIEELKSEKKVLEEVNYELTTRNKQLEKSK